MSVWNCLNALKAFDQPLKIILQRTLLKIIMIFLQFNIKWQEIHFSVFVTYFVISLVLVKHVPFKKNLCKIFWFPYWQWSLLFLLLISYFPCCIHLNTSHLGEESYSFVAETLYWCISWQLGRGCSYFMSPFPWFDPSSVLKGEGDWRTSQRCHLC